MPTDLRSGWTAELKAGIAWFAVAPKINGAGKIEGKITKQGYLALARNNLTYPAIAMTPSGQGVIAFTVMGQDFYPSAGYARIDAAGKVGAIHIAAAGLGPTDGFTSYKAFVGDPPRTRWGDYGAAVTDGNALDRLGYIGQTCTYAQYFPGPTLAGFGSCGGTRIAANWYTRLTKTERQHPHKRRRDAGPVCQPCAVMVTPALVDKDRTLPTPTGAAPRGWPPPPATLSGALPANRARTLRTSHEA